MTPPGAEAAGDALVTHNADMPIPVCLLTGFLGAGKTTCLRALLAADREAGRQPGLLLNDFGSLGIDAVLLEASAQVVTLVDGCLCCSLQDDLLLGLLALLDAGAEVVYIEPSGLADPVGLLEGLLVPDVLERCGPLQLLGVTAQGTSPVQDPEVARLWAQQLLLADGVLLTHAGERSSMELGEELRQLRQLGIRRPIAPVSHGNGVASIAAAWAAELSQSRGLPVGKVTPLGWQAIHLQPAMSRAADFDAWLQGLPEDVFRIKGFVQLDERPEWWVVQGVGRDRRRHPWSGDPGTAAGLILIGPGVAGDLWHHGRGTYPAARD